VISESDGDRKQDLVGLKRWEVWQRKEIGRIGEE
jgi:hypothetical protein